MTSVDFNNIAFLDPEVRPTQITPVWKFPDYLGALKMRTTLSRNKYTVSPGLYSIGAPNRDSEVLVSANYKLSFDVLRRSLQGINAWILVLDTKGINVWCAAGKGTFGTTELINRINATGIKSRINHKRIIVPQLGAPGVAAHTVKQATGLNVKYGPVRSDDIKEFISTGLKASSNMRHVKFSFIDRLTLAPVEMVYSSKYFLYSALFLIAIAGFDKLNFSYESLISNGFQYSLAMFIAFLTGTFLGPVLLPILPFRSFSIKGAIAGLLSWFVCFFFIFQKSISIETIAFLLAFIVVSSFFTMNFTGASTYTSLSGVKKEMKYAVPAQISAGVLSVVLFILSIFI